MLKIKELTRYLESLASLAYQEPYDNAGLLVGDPEGEVGAALISLDCTEEVILEAVRKGCGIVISHHPIIFGGLKKLTGKNYVERTVITAIRNNVAIYAIHTNLDNAGDGVNAKICEKLGIKDPQILAPKSNLLKKLVTFCPVARSEEVRRALFDAGAGQVGNYSGCSFNSEGFGTFQGDAGTHPFSGEPGEAHQEREQRIETIYPAHLEQKILTALFRSHPYEEVAYDIFSLSNSHPAVGAGMIGTIDPADELAFLRFAKEALGSKVIRHTALLNKRITRIAVCGGAGSFLLPAAIAAGGEMFITADYKYHEFFNAEGKIVIADAGHFETEQFTQELLYENIRKKFPTFALHLTELNTNPINYLI